MNNREMKVLRKLGFHPSRDNGKDHPRFNCGGWSRRFGRGPVTAVFYIRKASIDFEYRVLISNGSKAEDDVQWFDAEELLRLRRALRKMSPVWKTARRRLEGGLARRTIRRLFQ